jgi:tetratricopeptide (TPR) repeat protein
MRAAGRNDPCPCGSGKKYKRCCALAGAEAARPPPRDAALQPSDIGSLVALANAGAHEAAERGARGLLSQHPRAGILWKILSVALLRQGKAALPELHQAALLLPDDAEAHGNLGAAFCDLGRWAEALPSLRRALAIDPRNLQATADAGNAFFRSGRAEEAMGCYRRAIELDPGSADAHSNLGLCLASLGRREEAVANYEKALALAPRHAEALDNLGIAWRELGARRRAEALHRRALEIDPRRARSHYGIGSAQLERGRVEDAAASFQHVLDLEPTHVAAHLGLAAALRQQRRVVEAQAICERALALAPRSAEAVWLLGELRGDLGAFPEAQELYRRAIELDPSFPSAFSSMALQRRMTAADAPWQAGVEGLLAKGPPLSHAIGLRYALGKYFDDLGRHDEAFRHFRMANELTKRYGAVYDGEKLTRRIDTLIATFDAQFMSTPPRASASASASERPVFVLGMPRSGTSLAEQILASHPAVFGAGEISFWDDAFGAHHPQGWVGEAGAKAISAIADEYLVRTARAQAQAQAPAPAPALRVVDKMPANFLYAGLIHAAFPRARIIHLRRHPIDTCLSIYFQNFLNAAAFCNDLEHLAHYYREYVRITDHWRAVLPATAFLEVPYEDLVADQERWSRRMLEFIDLPWDPRCLEFHRAERVVITASKWQVRQSINAASVGRWRNYERHVGPLESLLREPAHGAAIDGAGANAQAKGGTGDAALPLKGSR